MEFDCVNAIFLLHPPRPTEPLCPAHSLTRWVRPSQVHQHTWGEMDRRIQHGEGWNRSQIPATFFQIIKYSNQKKYICVIYVKKSSFNSINFGSFPWKLERNVSMPLYKKRLYVIVFIVFHVRNEL